MSSPPKPAADAVGVTIRTPSDGSADRKVGWGRARYQLLCLVVLAVVLGCGLGLGTLAPAPAAAPELAKVVTLSTPASSLTTALASALRCDVALALAPLGVPLASIALVGSTSTVGADAPIAAADPANTNSTCAARRALLGRSLSAPTCATPLSQTLSSVRLAISSSGANLTAINAALAAATFTSS